MQKKQPPEKITETEQKTSVIAGNERRYQRLNLLLEALGILISVIGLLSNRFEPTVDVAPILFVVVFLFLLSIVVGEEARRVNWPSRINRLMFLKTLAESSPKQFGEHSPYRRLYFDQLRELYLVAVSEGRKELARELWLKGQLDSDRSTKPTKYAPKSKKTVIEKNETRS